MAAAAFLRIVDSPHKVSFEPRQGRIENRPAAGIVDVGRSAVSMLATLSPGPAASRAIPVGAAND
jgi:hypothetical protein